MTGRIESSRILLVDDQIANVRLLEVILKANHYTDLRSTTDSREVLSLFRDFNPDLILLDLTMPAMDGFEVMEQLRQATTQPLPPILVLTALTDRATLLRALSGGAKDFVRKPFDSLEVLARIRNLLEVHWLHKELREQNRTLEEKVRERTEEVRATQLQVIRRLTRAAECRDYETGMHIVRMSMYSSLLGRAAGMSETDAERLLNASPMHDVGKIGIPDRILLKPGKLDPDEWAIMKTHTTIGGSLLADDPSELLQTARTIALTHHEKWDGTGYPQGLATDAIPLDGRVCAVCDVFDALTSVRPYKQAWRVDEALGEIHRLAGTHFDPQLVDRFQTIVPQVVAIKERFTD